MLLSCRSSPTWPATRSARGSARSAAGPQSTASCAGGSELQPEPRILLRSRGWASGRAWAGRSSSPRCGHRWPAAFGGGFWTLITSPAGRTPLSVAVGRDRLCRARAESWRLPRSASAGAAGGIWQAMRHSSSESPQVSPKWQARRLPHDVRPRPHLVDDPAHRAGRSGWCIAAILPWAR